MIKGVGVDIVEIVRVKSNLVKILSKDEKDIWSNLSEAKKHLFIAGRWAAKEAIFKAWEQAPKDFSKINIIAEENGKPFVLGYPNIQISISHEKNYAVAIAIYTK